MKAQYLLLFVLFALVLPLNTYLSAQEATPDPTATLSPDSLMSVLDKFWKVMAWESDKTFCDELVASGFVATNHAAVFCEKFSSAINYAGEDLDYYYYEEYYTDEEIDEMSYEYEADLVAALENMGAYFIELVDQEELAQTADNNYFYELRDRIRAYTLK